MKRSEAVLCIELAFTLGYTIPEEDKRMVRELAELILYGLEYHIGMMPPYNPKYLDHGSITDCEWEPEEEGELP